MMQVWTISDYKLIAYERMIIFTHWLGIAAIAMTINGVYVSAVENRPYLLVINYMFTAINLCLLYSGYNEYRKIKIIRLLRKWSIANYKE